MIFKMLKLCLSRALYNRTSTTGQGRNSELCVQGISIMFEYNANIVEKHNAAIDASNSVTVT